MFKSAKRGLIIVMAVMIALLSAAPLSFAEGYTSEDLWVYVSAPDGGVNFRYGPGTEYGKVLDYMIPNGTYLYISGSEWSTNGKLWGETEYDGYAGWVFLEQCTFDQNSDPGDGGYYEVPAATNNAVSTPSNTYTAPVQTAPDTSQTQPAPENNDLPDDALEPQPISDDSDDDGFVLLVLGVLFILVVAVVVLLIVLLTRKKKAPAAGAAYNMPNNGMQYNGQNNMPNNGMQYNGQNNMPNNGMQYNGQNNMPNNGMQYNGQNNMPNNGMQYNGQNNMPNNGMQYNGQNNMPNNGMPYNGQNNNPYNGPQNPGNMR